MPNKKLLVITSTFFPAIAHGGPAVSVTNMANALSKHYDVTVITKRFADELKTEPYLSITDNKGANELFGCKVYYLKDPSFVNIMRIANEVKPDIVYTSSIFSAGFTFPALYYGKKHRENVRTVLSPRGELMPNPLSRKHFKKSVYLSALNIFGLLKNVVLHVTSEEEKKSVSSLYPNNKVELIKNIVDIKKSTTNHPFKNSGELKLISIGRIHPIKNIHLMIEAVGKCKGKIDYKIYGPKEDKAYYKKCFGLAETLDPDKKVEICGMIDHSKLEEIYSQSQVYLSLTQSENFGISIVEALSHSCPVVISKNTPWQFSSKDTCGYCVKIDVLDETINALNSFINMDEKPYRESCLEAYSWIKSRMGFDEILELYVQMFC